MIAHRTTVFEENPFHFSRRHRLSLTQTIPPGYRAVWESRQEIAKAKLHTKLTSKTKVQEYGDILMTDANAAKMRTTLKFTCTVRSLE